MNDTPQTTAPPTTASPAPQAAPVGGSLPPVDMSTFQPVSQSSALPPVDMSTFQALPNQVGGPKGQITATSLGDELSSGNANPNDNILERGLIHASGVIQGAGGSVINTAKNLVNMVPGVSEAEKGAERADPELAAKISTYMGKLTNNTSTPQKIGGGLETIGEFLAGDEALKGLSVGDRLLQTGKIAKVLESSPRLMNALKLGINVSEAATELTPEELELLKAHPILARLVGAGYDAIRHGAVQGAQTYVNTGSPKEAGKQAAEMAATSGALGVPLGIAGGIAAKTGQAAELHTALNAAAEASPTPEGVRNQVESTVRKALSPEQEAAAKTKDAAERDLEAFHAGTPSNQHLTEAVQQYAKDAEQNYHNAYTTGITGIKNELAGEIIPYENSPLHQAAKELVQQGEDTSKPLDVGFRKTRPGSPELNRRLDFLADPNKEAETEEAEPTASPILNAQGQQQPAAAVPSAAEEKPPIDLDINELLERRKELGEQLRNTGWSTDVERQDRGIYKRLIQGVDDTIEQMAQNASQKAQEAIANGETPANPNAANVLDRYQAINNAYRKSSRLFENKDVQSILAGDQADVMKRLLGGATNLKDINDVKAAFGEPLYNRFATDALQRFVADSVDDTGKINYKALLQKWNKLGTKPEVRDAAFGQFNADTFSNVLNGAVGADAKLNEINDTLAQVMGNGDVNALIKDPARLQQMASIVGPDAMTEVGKANLQSEIGKAARSIDNNGKTIYRFDPDKFLSWVASMKDNPEAVNTLYKATPQAEANFNRLLSDVGKVKTQKIKTMLGLGAVGSAATGTGAAIFGGPVTGAYTAFATILGEMVGAGQFKAARDVVERIATHPAMLKALAIGAKIGTAVASPTTQAVVAKTAMPVVNKGVNAVYSAAKGALGGSSTPTNPNQGVGVNPAPLTYDAGPMAGKRVTGMLQRGNIDLNHRPQIKNADGTSSTIFSMTVPIGADGHSVAWGSPKIVGYALVPSIVDGKFLTPDGKMPPNAEHPQTVAEKQALSALEDAATTYYDKTRQHLGIFKTSTDADDFATHTHSYGSDGTARKVFVPSV